MKYSSSLEPMTAAFSRIETGSASSSYSASFTVTGTPGGSSSGSGQSGKTFGSSESPIETRFVSSSSESNTFYNNSTDSGADVANFQFSSFRDSSGSGFTIINGHTAGSGVTDSTISSFSSFSGAVYASSFTETSEVVGSSYFATTEMQTATIATGTSETFTQSTITGTGTATGTATISSSSAVLTTTATFSGFATTSSSFNRTIAVDSYSTYLVTLDFMRIALTAIAEPEEWLIALGTNSVNATRLNDISTAVDSLAQGVYSTGVANSFAAAVVGTDTSTIATHAVSGLQGIVLSGYPFDYLTTTSAIVTRTLDDVNGRLARSTLSATATSEAFTVLSSSVFGETFAVGFSWNETQTPPTQTLRGIFTTQTISGAINTTATSIVMLDGALGQTTTNIRTSILTSAVWTVDGRLPEVTSNSESGVSSFADSSHTGITISANATVRGYSITNFTSQIFYASLYDGPVNHISSNSLKIFRAHSLFPAGFKAPYSMGETVDVAGAISPGATDLIYPWFSSVMPGVVVPVVYPERRTAANSDSSSTYSWSRDTLFYTSAYPVDSTSTSVSAGSTIIGANGAASPLLEISDNAFSFGGAQPGGGQETAWLGIGWYAITTVDAMGNSGTSVLSATDSQLTLAGPENTAADLEWAVRIQGFTDSFVDLDGAVVFPKWQYD